MLYLPERHERLDPVAWDAARARAEIRAIAQDMEAHLDPVRGWPAHPLDEIDALPATGMKSIYLGAAGNLWALWYLARAGAIDLSIDPAARVARLPADYRAEPDTEAVVPSLFLGEAGVLLVAWRITGDNAVAARLEAVIRDNIPNPTNEALWAAPGTMVAAWHMAQWTGEPRWRALFAENVEQVWRTWLPDEPAGCHLWTQDLYGQILQYLGAGHGYAGNVDPLLRGAALLPTDRRDALYARCVQTLRATAVHDGDAANWPAATTPRIDRPRLLMQWCHGSPGIVTGHAHFPPGLSREMDDLLARAGHAVWRAGPLTKGYGLCHGTAGNGYAFLALHRRDGDGPWLDRARAFAMHAIGQRRRMRAEHGCGRYTLYTGDSGLAVYLWHCIVGAGGMPGLDVLD